MGLRHNIGTRDSKFGIILIIPNNHKEYNEGLGVLPGPFPYQAHRRGILTYVPGRSSLRKQISNKKGPVMTFREVAYRIGDRLIQPREIRYISVDPEGVEIETYVYNDNGAPYVEHGEVVTKWYSVPLDECEIVQIG